MNLVIAFLRLAARISDGFFQTTPDAAGYLAHVFVLP